MLKRTCSPDIPTDPESGAASFIQALWFFYLFLLVNLMLDIALAESLSILAL